MCFSLSQNLDTLKIRIFFSICQILNFSVISNWQEAIIFLIKEPKLDLYGGLEVAALVCQWQQKLRWPLLGL